ncbi:MAG: aldehyde dehydrogenase (NADP(+)) [Pseudomonadota bacterium]
MTAQVNALQVSGEMVIGRRTLRGSAGQVRAYDPARKETMEPEFGLATGADVDAACELAAQAFDAYRSTAPQQRALFLETIADNIIALGATLIERAGLESGLPQARLEGERMRTANQLRLFARVVRDGYFHGATLDSALPERAPPRPDLRLRKVALGPVVVFGASNFPLAFSVAGGDTASALAAGCPVIVKAHGAHLGTSELVGKAVQQAAASCGMPEGVFSMLFGEGREIGQRLAAHPAVKAVGFTGSRQGGLALMRTAAQRAEPIPVYAEMSSINPVFMLPGALGAAGTALAQGFVDSLTLGVGQFCTNPGLVLGVQGEQFDSFVNAAAESLGSRPAGTMLTAGIHQAYLDGVQRMTGIGSVQLVAQGSQEGKGCAAQASLYRCSAETYLATPALGDEIFGPSALLIDCRDQAEMLRVAEHLEGQLTATVHAQAADRELAAALLPVLERKAGRILFNGFPTGVEVAHAMVHGGPFPATSDSRSTSVGATAIERFLRPVCYQNLPPDLLPDVLAEHNPLNLARLVDGKMQQPQ